MLLKRIKKFIKESRAQGALEYIMLIGGIIAVAVIVFTIYSRSVKTSAAKAEETAANVSAEVAETTKNVTQEFLKNLSQIGP